MSQKPPQLLRLRLLSARELTLVFLLAASMYFTGMFKRNTGVLQGLRGAWFSFFQSDVSYEERTPVFWYVDKRGVKHFVTSLGRVPPEYRRGVRNEDDLPVITRDDFEISETKVTSSNEKRKSATSSIMTGIEKKLSDKDSMLNSAQGKEALEGVTQGIENFKNFVGQ